MLKGLLEKLSSKQGKRVRVGKVDLALVQALLENEKAHDAVHEEIREKVKVYIESLKVEHEPRCMELSVENSAIWERVYDELDIPEREREEGYTVDHTTGVVSRFEMDPVSGFEEEAERPNDQQNKNEGSE